MCDYIKDKIVIYKTIKTIKLVKSIKLSKYTTVRKKLNYFICIST